ncbi:MAG: GAF domain-containing protein [Deltaproteobacteria bacterium]|nr:GAF domain-containing protein [Deltaproteobacteria bacterium]
MSGTTTTTAAAEEPHRLLGMRRSAFAEVLFFYAAALIFDAVVLQGQRYAGVTPHPFWLFSMLAAAYYGTATGVFAVVIGTLLAFVGNLPARDPLMDQSAWLLRVLGQPTLWFVSAVVLGELRTRRERVIAEQSTRLRSLEAENHSLSVSRMALEMSNERLQTNAAGQVETALSLVQAARTVDIERTGSVFESVEGMIRNLFQPTSYSVYLARHGGLELVAQTTDKKGQPAPGRYGAESSLYRAVMLGGRVVHVADPAGQEALGEEGIIAGPLPNPEGGAPIGMLKIEAMPIQNLGKGSEHAFRGLCEWIGTAYRNAQRFEEANRSRVVHAESQLFTDAYYRPVSAFIVALAERANFEVSQLNVRIKPNGQGDSTMSKGELGKLIEDVVTAGLRSTDIAFDYTAERDEFAIILPMTQAKNCKLVSDRLRHKIEARLQEVGQPAKVGITYETLYVPTAQDVKPWHRAVIRRTDPYTS